MKIKFILLSLILFSSASFVKAMEGGETHHSLRSKGISNSSFTTDPESLAGKLFRQSFNYVYDRRENEKKVYVTLTEGEVKKAFAESGLMKDLDSGGITRVLPERHTIKLRRLEKRQERLMEKLESLRKSSISRHKKASQSSHVRTLIEENAREIRKLQKVLRARPFDLIKDQQERNLLMATFLGHAFAPGKLFSMFGSEYKSLLEFIVKRKIKEGCVLGLARNYFTLFGLDMPAHTPSSAWESAQRLLSQSILSEQDLEQVLSHLKQLSGPCFPLLPHSYHELADQALISLYEKGGWTDAQWTSLEKAKRIIEGNRELRASLERFKNGNFDQFSKILAWLGSSEDQNTRDLVFKRVKEKLQESDSPQLGEEVVNYFMTFDPEQFNFVCIINKAIKELYVHLVRMRALAPHEAFSRNLSEFESSFKEASPEIHGFFMKMFMKTSLNVGRDFILSQKQKEGQRCFERALSLAPSAPYFSLIADQEKGKPERDIFSQAYLEGDSEIRNSLLDLVFDLQYWATFPVKETFLQAVVENLLQNSDLKTIAFLKGVPNLEDLEKSLAQFKPALQNYQKRKQVMSLVYRTLLSSFVAPLEEEQVTGPLELKTAILELPKHLAAKDHVNLQRDLIVIGKHIKDSLQQRTTRSFVLNQLGRAYSDLLTYRDSLPLRSSDRNNLSIAIVNLELPFLGLPKDKKSKPVLNFLRMIAKAHFAQQTKVQDKDEADMHGDTAFDYFLETLPE